MSAIKVQKIKILKDGVVVVYQQFRENFPVDCVTLESDDEPCTSLREAMDKFLDLVIAVCYLDSDFWKEQAKSANAFVSGVSIKETDDGYGLNVTAQLKDPEAGHCVVINTPYLRETGIETDLQITALQREAISYIKGKRKSQQLNLLEDAVV